MICKLCNRLLATWLHTEHVDTRKQTHNVIFPRLDVLWRSSSGAWSTRMPGPLYAVVKIVDVGIRWSAIEWSWSSRMQCCGYGLFLLT
jgi:hypothetical protein